MLYDITRILVIIDKATEYGIKDILNLFATKKITAVDNPKIELKNKDALDDVPLNL